MIKGSKHSEIARERIRIGHLGKKQSKEHIMSRVKSREGYRHSEETKQKLREIGKLRTGDKGANWKGGKPRCVDCNKIIFYTC